MRTELFCEHVGIEEIAPIHLVHFLVLVLGQRALGEIHDAVDRVGYSEKFLLVLVLRRDLRVHLTGRADLAVLAVIVTVVQKTFKKVSSKNKECIGARTTANHT